MSQCAAAGGTADLTSLSCSTGGRFIIVDHFPCGITAEGTRFDNLTMFRISCGSPFHFRHFMCQLAAFGDTAALAGLRRTAGGSFPVMTQGRNRSGCTDVAAS